MSYYLAASLPPLDLKEPAPWTVEAFGFHCQGALPPEAWREVMCFVSGTPADGESDFARWWTDLDTQIRNTQARWRAARLNVEARGWQRMHTGFDVAVETAVLDAMQHTNPRERELALDRCRWDALDERTAQAPFSLDAVCAYALKLEMVQRWNELDADTGLQRMETFIEEQVEAALESEEDDDE